MPLLPSLLLNPRLSSSLKPLLLLSQSSFAPRKFRSPTQLVSVKRRTFSSLSSDQSSDNGGRRGGGGRSGALYPSPFADEVQRIDVNPPKGTRDFPPADMRLREEISDQIEKIPVDEIKRELNITGLSEEAIEELLQDQDLSIKSLTKLEEILGGAGEAITDLKQQFSLAEKFDYSDWIEFDASVVCGLAYYTGIVFEGFDREGKLRAICGGGRYDRLLSTFGGDNVPACGFVFGDAVIVELLKEKGLVPELSLEVNNIVCALDRDLQGVAATVASKLGKKGQSVDLVLESKPIKWVFKRAERTNTQRLILVGNSEWQKGMVVVKVLSSGEQYVIKLDELG
ncbi:Histidyl-tRNA synthetase 1 isoform 2 [Hibiscus syriacus]|uniref:histidine--tRNA ligase n=1 Tax=Hibiscus syriacus TaxID=106335 RepID=A0A6A2YZY6_HIBSY|nr:Histidyl-tRNA synthetase 1 isoform 2 [Hibiscus syriacus]